MLSGCKIVHCGAGTTVKECEDDAVSGTNAMGIYFDDCDCGDEVYGNVFLNCPRGILIGGGRDHPVRSNVFINCRMGMSIDCRGISWKCKWNVAGTSSDLEGKAKKFGYKSGVWAARYPGLAKPRVRSKFLASNSTCALPADSEC